jgi:hypothetical protein
VGEAHVGVGCRDNDPSIEGSLLSATTLREFYQQLDVAVLDIPLGLETEQRVEWIAARVTAAGVAVAG